MNLWSISSTLTLNLALNAYEKQRAHVTTIWSFRRTCFSFAPQYLDVRGRV